MDGALTTQPMAPAVPPARNTSASSMQSPPANAEATSVITLSPGVGSAWGATQVQVPVNQFGQAQMPAQRGWQDQRSICHQRWSSKAIWMRSGWSSASIFWVLLAWGRFPVSKAIIPDGQEHFLTPSAHRDTHLFGGLELSRPVVLHHIGESGLIDRYPKELAKLLAYFGQCDTQPWFWHGTRDAVDRLLAKGLPPDLDKGLHELIARHRLG